MSRDRLAPPWLTARPIAHRGLHGAPTGAVENSLAAAEAAIAGGYGIECDVQLSRDGVPMVFHDFGLERLTGVARPLAALTAVELGTLAYRDGSGTIPTLEALLATVAGRGPLVVEIKSRFDGDLRLAEATAAAVAAYDGPVALKSFDPAIVARLRGGARPVGLVAQAAPAADAPPLPPDDFFRTVPDFLSWHVGDLPHAVPALCRDIGLPVMSWTVRTAAQRATAMRFADQIVFEGFRA